MFNNFNIAQKKVNKKKISRVACVSIFRSGIGLEMKCKIVIKIYICGAMAFILYIFIPNINLINL